MSRGIVVLASLGLGLNVILWSGPGLIAASGAVSFVVDDEQHDLPRTLQAVQRARGQTPAVHDALVNLIGAEAEAMQVAGQAIEHPTTPDLGQRADQAGAHVLDAVRTYIRSVSAVLQR